MRGIRMWAAVLLLFSLILQLKDTSAESAFSSNVNFNSQSLPSAAALAWHQQQQQQLQQQQRNQFGRNSRDFLQRSASSIDAGGGGGVGGGYKDYSQLFDDQQSRQQQKQQQQQRPQLRRRQQTEIYGIVEPLIEDTPCVDRACLVNDDCCPTGVCVNTYGEGKCVYVYGRKRNDEIDQCQSHADCPTGSICTLSTQIEGIWRCEMQKEESSLMQEMFGLKPKHSLGSDCISSSDCQVNIGMCCQQQRLHHRAITKLSCGYFRDAFDCIDMAEHRNI